MDRLYETMFGNDEDLEVIKENCEFLLAKINANNDLFDWDVEDIFNLSIVYLHLGNIRLEEIRE